MFDVASKKMQMQPESVKSNGCRHIFEYNLVWRSLWQYESAVIMKPQFMYIKFDPVQNSYLASNCFDCFKYLCLQQ